MQFTDHIAQQPRTFDERRCHTVGGNGRAVPHFLDVLARNQDILQGAIMQTFRNRLPLTPFHSKQLLQQLASLPSQVRDHFYSGPLDE